MAVRSILTVAIMTSQRFIRDKIYKGEPSSVTLRDIKRAVKEVPWMMTFLENREAARKTGIPGALHNLPEDSLQFYFLQASICASLFSNYALRLPIKYRAEYSHQVVLAWTNMRDSNFRNLPSDFLTNPSDDSFYEAYNDVSSFLASLLPCKKGIAINEALRENVFSLFSGLTTMTPTCIVGSSKSLSVELLVAAAGNRQHPFFKYYPSLQKFVLQCSPMTTADSIMQLAGNALRFQRKHKYDEVICSPILEEVGVPLMCLHFLMDEGEIAIVALSNWKLDPTKMNRVH